MKESKTIDSLSLLSMETKTRRFAYLLGRERLFVSIPSVTYRNFSVFRLLCCTLSHNVALCTYDNANGKDKGDPLQILKML